ncbi:tyrosine-protein phosphatase [Hutsoniella sourekii]|uniref:tyrosine-protein phosphatase n=1 Tax=Hutsoniella sourekii TaxID=87650 RepID=UPI0004B5C2E7|nr:CpsB/CapC family capsule biosynthesis tyrosine phosphatase [Hutsoniella sourekii]
MIIDLHSHLLPGVDDGAKDLEASLTLARLAVEEGIEHLVLTPHHNNRQFVNPGPGVVQATQALQAAYDQAGIPLKVYPAQEIRLTEAFLDELYAGQLLSLDGGGRYYLIEFPTREIPACTEDVLQALIDQGSTPVIAHPERQHNFQKDLDYYASLIERGCLGQLTNGSLAGRMGPEVEAVSREMINRGLVHFLSSDVHHPDWRPFDTRAAYQVLEDTYGSDKVASFKQVARAVINGDPVEVAPVQRTQPVHRKKKNQKKAFWQFLK